VSHLKIKISSKNMYEKPTKATIIHSVCYLCMVSSTCFGITLPSSGSTVDGFLSVYPPEEHHEKRTFCTRGGNLRKCDSGSAIDF
jgi:hypothetical protein